MFNSNQSFFRSLPSHVSTTCIFTVIHISIFLNLTIFLLSSLRIFDIMKKSTLRAIISLSVNCVYKYHLVNFPIF